MPPRSVAHDGPTYQRPFARPDVAGRAAGRPRPRRSTAPEDGAELRETLLRLAASPNLCDKSWITDQYDRYVRGNTVLAQPSDAGMVRIDEETGLGVAVSTDCNGRFARLDPYAGAQLALAESYRNVATGGARPLAVSDCLNFGSPEDPAVMWQFAEACRGLKDGCLELGVPVTGGNVSLYNQTGETAILPTPGRRGARRHRRRHPPYADRLRRRGRRVVLLGETREELSGSEWAHVVHGHLGGLPPRVDLAAERALADLLADAGRSGCSPAPTTSPTAGWRRRWSSRRCATASAPRSGSTATPFVELFSESAARAVVTVADDRLRAAADDGRGARRPDADHRGHRRRTLEVEGWFDVPLAELREAWTATLPAALG